MPSDILALSTVSNGVAHFHVFKTNTLFRKGQASGQTAFLSAAASQQIIDRQYMEPFKADERQVIGLAIELDENGKGLLDWKRME